MEKWRDVRDSGETLSANEPTELEKLIEAEVEGSGKRARKRADQLGERAVYQQFSV